LVALGSGVALAWVLYRFDPARSGFYPRCLFHEWTGLSCPGCGSLRALHQLLHGRVAAAFALNPLLIAALPWLGVAFLSDCGAIRRAGPSSRWVWGMIGVILTFWLVRNLPVDPFRRLAP